MARQIVVGGAFAVALVTMMLVAGAGLPAVAQGDPLLWGVEAVDTEGDTGWQAAMVLNIAGRPHVAYVDRSDGDLRYAANTVSGEWTITPLPDSAGGEHPGIGLTLAQEPRIAYGRGGSLYVTARSSGVWTTTLLDAEGDTGHWARVALDRGDNAYVLYQTVSSGEVRLAAQQGGEWVTETVAAGRNGDLVLDTGGRTHAVFYDPASERLQYGARAFLGGWTFETVDSGPGIGEWNAIALESGTPHVAYYDAHDGDLKYAIRQAGSWATEVLDAEGNRGTYVDLVVDNFRRRHVAYGDTETGDIRYATFDGDQWYFAVVDPAVGLEPWISLGLGGGRGSHLTYYADGDLLHAAEELPTRTPMPTETPGTTTPRTGTPGTGTPSTGTPSTGTPTPATGTPATATASPTLGPGTPSLTPDPRTPTSTASLTPDPRTPSSTPDPRTPSVTADPRTPTSTVDPRTPSATSDPRTPSATSDPRTPSATLGPETATAQASLTPGTVPACPCWIYLPVTLTSDREP